MNNHIQHLLSIWSQQRDQYQWVLGTVYQTQGSAYRKAGSHMLFNDAGQYYGLLSGGCLERDLHKKAMQALHKGQAITVRYDSTETDSEAYQLGLGCGGIIDILLQPIFSENSYLQLPQLQRLLENNKPVTYRQYIPREDGLIISQLNTDSVGKTTIVNEGGSHWLHSHISPLPNIAVFGGGVDARPLVSMASQLGWSVNLVDSRPASARMEHFSTAKYIERIMPDDVIYCKWYKSVNAAVIMMHNTELDALALQVLARYPPKALRYCALLGPVHRKQQVLEIAAFEAEQLPFILSSPAGLDIGAELPEEIALSILAEYQLTRYQDKL